MALFAGGCGLFYFVIGNYNAFTSDDAYGLRLISVIIGIVPGILGGLVAWWAFRKGNAQ